MSCWEILGIEQTSDLTAIKAAYAAKAKEWHPEEHPEEFQLLQRAYRDAVHMAKLHRAKSHKAAIPVHTAAANRDEALSGSAAETGELSQTAIEKDALSKASAEPEEAKQEITTKAPVNEEDTGGRPQGFGHEEAGKSPQDPGYEEIREQSQGFDYEEVGAADLEDQFFREFFSIAWNPYLMNNLVCWEYILKCSPYEQLLSDSGFRRNFVLTACHQLMGWQRGTILLFERWLKSRPAGDAGRARKTETDLFCWKFRKIGLFGKMIPTQRCVTNEQKQLHEIFLAQVERCGMDTGLKSEKDVECYLSFYLPYAAGKQSRIKQLYHGSCQGRIMLTTLLMMVPFFIGMVIYVQVCVVPQMNERKAGEAERQRIEQRAEEIRQYGGSFQNGGYSEPEWLQEYYDDIIRKGEEEH